MPFEPPLADPTLQRYRDYARQRQMTLGDMLLDQDLEHFPGCLRLHLDGRVGLNGAARPRRDHDVAAFDRHRLVDEGRWLLCLGAGREKEAENDWVAHVAVPVRQTGLLFRRKKIPLDLAVEQVDLPFGVGRDVVFVSHQHDGLVLPMQLVE